MQFGVPGFECTRTKGYIHLPLAGPDVTNWAKGQMEKVAKFANRTDILDIGLYDSLRLFYYVSKDRLDWAVQQNSQCDYLHNFPTTGEVPTIPDGEDETFTISGVVVDEAKFTNMMWSHYLRAWDFQGNPIIDSDVFDSPYEFAEWFAGQYATPDDSQAKAAYKAGERLFYGESLKDVMRRYGYAMQYKDKASGIAWPNDNTSDGSEISVPHLKWPSGSPNKKLLNLGEDEAEDWLVSKQTTVITDRIDTLIGLIPGL